MLYHHNLQYTNAAKFNHTKGLTLRENKTTTSSYF